MAPETFGVCAQIFHRVSFKSTQNGVSIGVPSLVGTQCKRPGGDFMNKGNRFGEDSEYLVTLDNQVFQSAAAALSSLGLCEFESMGQGQYRRDEQSLEEECA